MDSIISLAFDYEFDAPHAAPEEKTSDSKAVVHTSSTSYSTAVVHPSKDGYTEVKSGVWQKIVKDSNGSEMLTTRYTGEQLTLALPAPGAAHAETDGERYKQGIKSYSEDIHDYESGKWGRANMNNAIAPMPSKDFANNIREYMAEMDNQIEGDPDTGDGGLNEWLYQKYLENKDQQDLKAVCTLSEEQKHCAHTVTRQGPYTLPNGSVLMGKVCMNCNLILNPFANMSDTVQ